MFRSWFLVALLTVGPALATPNVRVTLLPPDLTGQPGETVGWSFSIEMLLPNLWAVVNGIQFLWDAPIGTVNPFSVPPELVIGPGVSPNQNPYVFNYASASNGLVNSYTIDVNAQPGDIVRGDLRFSFTVFNEDVSSPNFDPDVNVLGSEDVDVATSIAVPLSGQDIPEASTLGMVVAGLAAVLAFRRRRP
jgi:hypothetical protein